MIPGRAAAVRGALAIGLLIAGTAADAHLASSGLGPAYDGALHFLTSPEDLVPVLALALLAGLRGAAHGRRVLFTLAPAWLLGGLAGLGAVTSSAGLLGAALWFVLLGGLVVFDARLSVGAVAALAALLGLFHGYLNGSGMGATLPAVVALGGLAASVFVVAALGAAAVVPLRAAWARIAVRVGGSWIAASGVLMLGWSLRGG